MKNVKVVKDDTAKLMKALRSMTKEQVLVGIPSKTAGRRPDPDEEPGLTNAVIGFLMENGSPALNIPARPHLKPGVAGAKDKLVASYRTGCKAVLDGRVSMTQVHTTAGLIAQSAVRAKITKGPFIPLSPRTLAERRARGRTGVKPLIDTGQYRNAINFVIRAKG